MNTDQPTTILDRVQSHYEHFVAFANPHHSFVLALWTLHTHAFEASYVTPYIYVSSMDPGAGKTTLMETAADVVRNGEIQAGVTPASIYRSLTDDVVPTYIIDETDAIWSGAKDETLRRVINSGYKYNGYERIFVQGESQRVPTFCPKMLGGIDNGQLPATIEDRSIRIRLRKLDIDELAERNVAERDIEELAESGIIEEMQEELFAWASIETQANIKAQKPERGTGMSARQWEISKPLIKIAMLFGREQEAREALIAVFEGEKVETEEQRILRIAADAFGEHDRITTSTLAELVGYTTARLSRTLSPLGITARPVKINGEVTRGYMRNEFETAWERFL